MNKELIKKYKKEFNHWLNGGKILGKFKGANWEDFTSFSWNPYGSEELVIKINDEYAEFRKAHAEGKTIQVNLIYTDDVCWVDMPDGLNFQYTPNNYRIKPDEPKFRVGDWVQHPEANSPWKLTQASIANLDNSKLRLWKPEEFEWCWFWNNDGRPPILGMFVQELGERYARTTTRDKPIEVIKDRDYQSWWNHCEPYIGQLPTELKE